MSVRVASDEKADCQAAIAEHGRRVVDGLRRLPPHEQIAHVSAWFARARAVRKAVHGAERTVNTRERNRTRPADLNELIAEAARRAGECDSNIERGIAAAVEHLSSVPQSLPPEVVTGSAMWVAAATARPALSAWPLANAEHMLVSAGMYAFGSKLFLPQHVAVFALVELGHTKRAIATALGLKDAARVRELVRTNAPACRRD